MKHPDGWIFWICLKLVAANVRFLQGGSTSTFTITTVTTTSDPCVLATDACACAAGKVCAWLVFGGGGGRCDNRGQPTEIDCNLCDAQAKCASTNCPQITDPCECAVASGCAWDMGFGVCLVSTVQTDCRACPTQVGCNLDPPVLLPNGYNPSNGGSHSSGSDLNIVLQFNRPVQWCAGTTGDDVSFWCSGSVNDQIIPRSKMGFSTTTLTIDMQWYLSSLSLETQRTCGVEIGLGRICDTDSVAFVGLARGAYSFQLLDMVGPTLVDFDPNSISELVPLDGSVGVVWSEAIMLNPSVPMAVLSRLEVDGRGFTTIAQSFSIPLEEPTAEIVSSSLLRVWVNGLIRSGKSYTLELPAGGVMDLAGNLGAALPAERFNFRAATSPVSASNFSPTSNSTAVGVVIVVVCAAVCCILAVGIGVVRLYRSHADAIGKLIPKHKVRPAKAKSQHLSPPVVEKDAPTFSDATAAAESAYRAAAAAAERLRQPEEDKAGAPNAPNASWAQRPSSKGPGAAGAAGAGAGANSKPGAKVHPEREGFNAGRARRSNPHANEGAKSEGARTATAPPPESNLPPEVKAVEKKLHDLMDEPIATRRKLFKELLVEYHPDKNSSSHAKEVFQYVNNARSWFLVES